MAWWWRNMRGGHWTVLYDLGYLGFSSSFALLFLSFFLSFSFPFLFSCRGIHPFSVSWQSLGHLSKHGGLTRRKTSGRNPGNGRIVCALFQQQMETRQRNKTPRLRTIHKTDIEVRTTSHLKTKREVFCSVSVGGKGFHHGL